MVPLMSAQVKHFSHCNPNGQVLAFYYSFINNLVYEKKNAAVFVQPENVLYSDWVNITYSGKMLNATTKAHTLNPHVDGAP